MNDYNHKLNKLQLGDDINTDDIIPAMRCTTADPEHLGKYALEHLVGEDGLKGYDSISAGKNFGCGSSREHAPLALKAAGINHVLAESFAQIFFRNSVNIGLSIELAGVDQKDETVQAIIDAGGLSAFNRQILKGQRTMPKSNTLTRPMTLTEKIIAKASGNAYVRPGETVFVQVDLAMSHDAVAGPVAQVFYKEFGRDAKVWEPENLVLVADHFIQVNDIRQDSKTYKLHDSMRNFAAEQGCHLLDVVAEGEAQGICHVLLPERGFIEPGIIIAGTDSHTCTYGAFGCFSTGVGTTDMANILATGQMWITVPKTIRIEFNGSLPVGVSAKDLMLLVLGTIGTDGAVNCVLEFAGEVISQLSIDERMTLSNMAIECGAMCGIIEPDSKTLEYLSSRRQNKSTDKSFKTVGNDSNCEYAEVHQLEVTQLKPLIACPSRPDNVKSIEEVGKVKIDRAYIGSCTGGKLQDIAEASKAIKGQQVAKGVSLFIVPASQEVLREAERLGYVKALEKAGAQFLKSGCGACINAGKGNIHKEEVGIYATNRNFKGRSGDASGKIYLASPRTVAISSVRGEISAEPF